MATSINRQSRVFFWLKKEKTQKESKPVNHIQKQDENITIASFWQNQLMNIANDNQVKK